MKKILAMFALSAALVPSAFSAVVGGSAASLYSNTGPGLSFTQSVSYAGPAAGNTNGLLTLSFNGDFDTPSGEDFRVIVNGIDFGIVGDGNTANDRFSHGTDSFLHDTDHSIQATVTDAELLAILSAGTVSMTFQDIAATGDWIDWINKFDWQVSFVADDSNNVPEPGSLALFGAGLAGLAAARRRKQA